MKSDEYIGAFLILCVPVLIAACFGMAWYRAGIQQSVYAREGIKMTRWEVYMGAKPAERQISNKPEAEKP